MLINTLPERIHHKGSNNARCICGSRLYPGRSEPSIDIFKKPRDLNELMMAPYTKARASFLLPLVIGQLICLGCELDIVTNARPLLPKILYLLVNLLKLVLPVRSQSSYRGTRAIPNMRRSVDHARFRYTARSSSQDIFDSPQHVSIQRSFHVSHTTCYP